jgi:ribosomal protein S21|tara:strand:- start:516 stop:761 length:246 start_codon:yes stop_codon:yes gene_type:complete
MKKGANVKVTAKECRGDVNRMIKRFIKKTKKEKIVEQVRERRYYKKRSELKKEKIRRAERQRRRDEQKRQRAQERRNRKNK